MKKKFTASVCFFIYGCLSLQARESINVSFGGMVGATGQVKFIRISAPLSGRGKAPLLGAGLPYTKKSTPTRISAEKTALGTVKSQPAEISSEFILGEVYIYPNPARGGQIPTFHTEVGIADSVKITIYTVSGDVAHTYTINGQPSTIDDGHGLEYAYEYAWRGHIPSGVYYYAIEAQKAGKKLRKTGKFAVIR